MSKIQKQIPVEVQNRSGSNCGHSNSFTTKCGTIMPILCDHVMPNTTINLDVSLEVNLPPAISDFYGEIEGRMEFFFVPYQIIWAGWKYFFTQPPQGGANLIQSNKPTSIRINDVPGFKAPIKKSIFGAGTLADMLGFKFPKNYNWTAESDTSQGVNFPNILPFVGYHLIYDHFYRDSRITQPLFYPHDSQTTQAPWTALPWEIGADNGTKRYYANGQATGLFELHQRCWDKDYFTNATYAPQAGDMATMEFQIQTTPIEGAGGPQEGTGSFSMGSLYVLNALERFAVVNNIAGQRMGDQQYARFGCYPELANLERPIYLGQKRFSIYKRSVYQQVAEANSVNSNPFSGLLGNKNSALSGYGEGFMGKFHAKDAGLVFCMFTLVPKATYSTGTRKYLSYSKLSHFPEPLLQHIGDQPIFNSELIGGMPTVDGDFFDNPNPSAQFSTGVFGYTQRFSEAKFLADEVHGLLRDGESLSMFQLQRSFDSTDIPALSTEFLEIPQDYLDQVFTADVNVSNYGGMCFSWLDFKKVQPLGAYSLPTLGDPKDTHTVLVDSGGQRL